MSEIYELEQRIAALEQVIKNLPSRWAGGSTPIFPLMIIGGQEIADAGGIVTYGIKKVATDMPEIPAGTYDPGTCDEDGVETGAPTPDIDAWPDGIGPANILTNAGWSRTIACNDARSITSTVLNGGADDDTTFAPSFRQDTCLVQRRVAIALDDDTSISAWAIDYG